MYWLYIIFLQLSVITCIQTCVTAFVVSPGCHWPLPWLSVCSSHVLMLQPLLVVIVVPVTLVGGGAGCYPQRYTMTLCVAHLQPLRQRYQKGRRTNVAKKQMKKKQETKEITMMLQFCNCIASARLARIAWIAYLLRFVLLLHSTTPPLHPIKQIFSSYINCNRVSEDYTFDMWKLKIVCVKKIFCIRNVWAPVLIRVPVCF